MDASFETGQAECYLSAIYAFGFDLTPAAPWPLASQIRFRIALIKAVKMFSIEDHIQFHEKTMVSNVLAE